MLTKKICVFDFETDGSDPTVCSPVQLAAVIVDPIKLEIIDGSEFNSNCKPELMQDNNDYKYETDIIDFHARVKGCSKEQVYDLWKAYPTQEIMWKSFVSYLEKYHDSGRKTKTMFSAPIACGYNINKFDLKIIDRLSAKYKNIDTKEGRSALFYPRDVLDIMNLVFYWFESCSDLKSLSMDSLREYLGISKDGGHDAIKDVKDTAQILIRFMRLHRNLSKKISFKGSFLNGD